MTFVRDLSGNNPTDLKYSPFNRTAADLTAVLALTGLYPGEIVEALNTGRKYRWLGAAWGLIGPVTSVVAGTLPPPSIILIKAAGQADPAGSSPILFTATFSQDVIGFATGDVTVTGTAGGTKTATVTGGPSVYSIAVTGMTTSGSVILDIAGGVATGAGGANAPSNTATCAWVVDTTKPSVTIVKQGGQADPTSGSSIFFTVAFDEVVTGFATGDVVTTGSTTGGTLTATVTGSGTTYTVAVTGMAAPSGNVVVGVPAGVAQDLAGNTNNAAPSTATCAWTTGAVAPTVQTYFFEAMQY
jgi:hypothetical protein